VTSNPDFKIFDVEHIRNGTRYRQCYNEIGLLVGTYTRNIILHDLE